MPFAAFFYLSANRMILLNIFIFLTFIGTCHSQFVGAACIHLDALKNNTSTIELDAHSERCIDIDVSYDARYFVIEAHTQRHNITISEMDKMNATHYSISGTGVGFVSMIETSLTTRYWIFNLNKDTVKVMLDIISYFNNQDPIPGGCNMEFAIEISPFLKIYYNHGYSVVEYQNANVGYPPRKSPPSCSIATNYISYDVYFYFLKENNFDEEDYFKGISLMQDVSSIKKYGKLVKPYVIFPRTRATFTSYPGQGVIYNIIASYNINGTMYEAAYVPLATYGCSFDSEVDGCGHLTGSLGKLFALTAAAIGLFIGFRGHRFLTVEMAYFGFIFFAFISFIFLTRAEYVTGDRDILTMVCGVCGGLFWAGVWWLFGIPVISVLIVGFVLGLLLTSVIFFTPLGNLEMLRVDVNYWMLLSCGVLIVPIILISKTKFLNIVGCAVIGSYAIVVAIDRYIGTTISYIVLNVVKRAVVDEFYLASNEVPFQTNEIVLCSVWALISILMITFQLYSEKGRAPFPPTPLVEKIRKFQLRHERREIVRAILSHQNSASVYDSDEEGAPLLAPISTRAYSTITNISSS